MRTGPVTSRRTRRIVEAETGETVTASVHARDALRPGATLIGPAVILEDGTTTVIPSGRVAWIGADSEIVIEESAE